MIRLANVSRAEIEANTPEPEKFSADFRIKKFVTNGDEQIVYGEVYAPYIMDTHEEMMLPEDVRKMCHRFLLDNKNGMIDIMHNNEIIHACVVETFIARPGDPDFAEGAWVAATKIDDTNVWADARAGILNGYSIEAWVVKVQAEVEYDYLPLHYGIVEKNDGHNHAYYVEVDEVGRVIRGYTSEDDGHSHQIDAGTATEICKSPGILPHAHRYFLNEISE